MTSHPTTAAWRGRPSTAASILTLAFAALAAPAVGCIPFAAPPAPVDGATADGQDVDDTALSCVPGTSDASGACRVCDGAGELRPCPLGCDAAGACLPAAAIVAGRAHVCVTGAAGTTVRCWGEAAAPWPDDEAIAVPGGAAVSELAAGADHLCLRAGGDVFCVGDNAAGQCGQPLTVPRTSAPVRVALPAPATALFGGRGRTTCAKLEGGAAVCWGALLDGHDARAVDAVGDPSPHAIPGGDAGVTAIAIGASHACWIRDGAVACWGDNAEGQLGLDDRDDRPEPTPVPGLSTGVSAIAAGRAHTCALTASGLACWGHNTSGQVGQRTAWSPVMSPTTKAVGTATRLTALALGSAHTLVLDESGVVRCFGDNLLTQCGVLGIHGRFVQIVGGLPAAGALASGDDFACALDRAGLAWCWGASPDQARPAGATAHLVVP